VVVPEKRKLMVVGAAIAAAFVLTGCAPAGVNAADYGDSTEPVAANAGASPGATADPSATSDPNAEVDPNATAPPGSDDAGTDVAADKVTTSLTGTAVKRMGAVIEDQGGFVLYRFDGDENDPSKSNCDAECAKVWHPALTNDGKPKIKGVDATLVSTVTRTDGTKQLTVKGWPVYHYIGDVKAGTWKGQNVAGKWFVIRPDGAKNLTCLPAVSKQVAPPADDSSSGSGGDYSY
jgi:predicted lipoprotein with Yx(FWY)xxD motif